MYEASLIYHKKGLGGPLSMDYGELRFEASEALCSLLLKVRHGMTGRACCRTVDMKTQE